MQAYQRKMKQFFISEEKSFIGSATGRRFKNTELNYLFKTLTFKLLIIYCRFKIILNLKKS